MNWDYLIVGAGLTGATCARLLSEQDKTCLVIDKRKHIGGNCYDALDEHGILTHYYGPHHFHTNNQEVLDFVSRFTGWITSEYKAMCLVNNKLYSFPVSLLTFEQLTGKTSLEDMKKHLNSVIIANDNPMNSEEFVLSRVGPELFSMFYEGYTQKMWGRPARELGASVCGRIPIYHDRDDRYFQDMFQGVPDKGYTALFRRMLDHPNIKVFQNCDFKQHRVHFKYKHLIYTGMIDEYYEHIYGRLPYRTLRFEHGPKEDRLIQPVCAINYPGLDIPYTRSVEIKHITKQDIPYTKVIKEYPEECNGKNEPYYPIPAKDNDVLYQKYVNISKTENNVTFAGRLGSYQYLNMDEAIMEAFNVATMLRNRGE